VESSSPANESNEFVKESAKEVWSYFVFFLHFVNMILSFVIFLFAGTWVSLLGICRATIATIFGHFLATFKVVLGQVWEQFCECLDRGVVP
jgi:hypothetical protein